MIAVDLYKQKELDADPRAIQQIEFYGKLRTNSQVCTVLEKSKEKIEKVKIVVKNEQGTTLRMNARMFNGNNLPHELFLTQRQTTKLRNNIENNLQTDIK